MVGGSYHEGSPLYWAAPGTVTSFALYAGLVTVRQWLSGKV